MNTDASSTGRIKHNWLAAMLLRQSEAVQARFARIYLQLRQQPRNVRRKLMRRYGTSLAGLALVVTLGGGTLYPAAHAQSQQRQGRRGVERVELANGLHNVPIGALSRGAAATITVDGTTCTLADALVSANTNTAVGGCIAGTGDDVIDIQADVTLSADLPPISSNIIVQGNNHVVDGDDQYSAFKVATASGDLTINNLTVKNAYTSQTEEEGGGGPALRVYDAASLTLKDSLITANTTITANGGAMLVMTGTVTIDNSSFTDNRALGRFGGAIMAQYDSTIQITNSNFDNNSAPRSGGAITVDGRGGSETNLELLISKTTFANNRAEGFQGGALDVYSDVSAQIDGSTFDNNTCGLSGGALYVGSYVEYGTGTLNVENSTITNNTAGVYGGAILTYGGGSASFKNVTMTGNHSNGISGAVSQSSFYAMELVNSIISGNTADNGFAEIEYYSGTLTTANNVIGDNSHTNADAFYYFDPDPTDIIATIDGNLPTALGDIIETDGSRNPLLADNGGPTHTVAIVDGSPAIDIAATGPDHDQRGLERPVEVDDSEQPYDAGAYEFDALPPPTKLYLPILRTEPAAPQGNAEQSLFARLFAGLTTLWTH